MEKPAFRLIGLAFHGKTTNKNNQSEKDCGDLWQKFEQEKIAARIPGKLSETVYAVYFDYESDENGRFSYFIGCKADDKILLPEGLDELYIPAQHYEQVTAKGVMTGCITEAWQKVWDTIKNRKFGYDFEVYDERSRDWNDATVDICISIQD